MRSAGRSCERRVAPVRREWRLRAASRPGVAMAPRGGGARRERASGLASSSWAPSERRWPRISRYGLGAGAGAALAGLLRVLRQPPATVIGARVFRAHQLAFVWSARFLRELNPSRRASRASRASALRASSVLERERAGLGGSLGWHGALLAGSIAEIDWLGIPADRLGGHRGDGGDDECGRRHRMAPPTPAGRRDGDRRRTPDGARGMTTSRLHGWRQAPHRAGDRRPWAFVDRPRPGRHALAGGGRESARVPLAHAGSDLASDLEYLRVLKEGYTRAASTRWSRSRRSPCSSSGPWCRACSPSSPRRSARPGRSA